MSAEHSSVELDLAGWLGGRTAELRGTDVVVLGMGHALRGDDAVGPALCERLQDHTAAHVIDAGTMPENYIEPILRLRPRLLLVVDAVDWGAAAGHVALLAPDQLSAICTSTHDLSPRLFVQMIHQQIDVECWFVAVQPAQLHLGQALSPAVERAVNIIADAVQNVLPKGSAG